jgi:dolichol-phosphate mannosyltransferase
VNKKEISIILPVLNEEENLKFIIPDLSEILIKLVGENFEIIVIDDQSIDNTKILVKDFISSGYNIAYKLRNGVKSLPLSIFEGIEISKYKNVLWMDADGSMDVDSVKILISTFFNKDIDVVVGSRFVKDGGYKGLEKNSNKSFLNIVKNLKDSEDSALAVYLSIVFNKLLKTILSAKISDLTSGFIVGQKKYFDKEMFEKFTYGEYFVFVVMKLLKNNIQILEVGYFCKPRQFGKSKTSSSISRLIRLSYPYLKIAYKSRKELNED